MKTWNQYLHETHSDPSNVLSLMDDITKNLKAGIDIDAFWLDQLEKVLVDVANHMSEGPSTSHSLKPAGTPPGGEAWKEF